MSGPEPEPFSPRTAPVQLRLTGWLIGLQDWLPVKIWRRNVIDLISEICALQALSTLRQQCSLLQHRCTSWTLPCGKPAW